ncbi:MULTISPECIES: N-acetyl-gamma-glutamyl-phosphate reductase [unclassified Pseudomonas]|uniref:N-acetyl-gamma-glutamyl-phosphate reductase n=1 Tax=unclassified Pseudomonas TaxID=196821 RepID=UPI000D3D108A|nr:MULTISPECIES: N-acetyl-gamma-glutamyl-phosphate reductase [unclassified Pseudomonas]RAU45071.1 N-acetyl-gamma-glutamyl-phosphate reductase [Pseudomonas sp. RIT 409]RAU51479.1 N-acetyl-gamma-glutamyl-phosphate reductase [Pseudomonas sp. RIT 412]
MTLPVVFIDGDQGTTGLQIHQRLHGRTDITLVTLPAEQRKQAASRAAAINACDIAILCLPDDAAREAAMSIENPDVRVIDASSAHRTDPQWVYGFAELNAEQKQAIASAKRVSNPGCYPTGAIGLLRPLLDAGLVPRDYPITVNAVSGYSGKGRAGVDEFEGDNAGQATPFQIYGLGLAHKHVPEIQQYSGLTERPVFIPAYGSFRQGIVLTTALQTRLLPSGVTGASLHACLTERYAGSRFVEVLSMDASKALTGLDPRQMNATDRLRLMVFENAGHVMLAAVFDNLGKGAAGAAVQNLDLMLGA